MSTSDSSLKGDKVYVSPLAGSEELAEIACSREFADPEHTGGGQKDELPQRGRSFDEKIFDTLDHDIAHLQLELGRLLQETFL